MLMVTSSVTATTFLDGYLQFLREDGWDVTLVCSDGSGVAELVSRAGVRYVPLAMERDPAPFRDIASFIACVRLLRRHRPAVLVYATPKASLIGSVAGWVTRVPERIYELWGLRLETTSGVTRKIFTALESLTMRLSTVVIANSRSLAERVSEMHLNNGRRTEVLGAGSSHGVDSLLFSRNAVMPDLPPDLKAALDASDAPVLGFVGRLHPDKGIDTLLDALEVLDHRGTHVQCLLVGGDEGAMEKPAHEHTSTTLHLTGHVDDPRPYIREMDLLVLPSRREGFPNVVLEAASMEVPAVVSDATGCIDSVVAGITGEVFPVGDAHMLADTIEALLSNPSHLFRLGVQARDVAVRRFDPYHVWKAHSDAFRAAGQHDVRGPLA